jgi:hypothetical protein
MPVKGSHRTVVPRRRDRGKCNTIRVVHQGFKKKHVSNMTRAGRGLCLWSGPGPI